MSESRFGYPSVKVGEFSNEQNITNLKTFCYSMSNNMEYYMQQQQDQIEALTELVKALQS